MTNGYSFGMEIVAENVSAIITISVKDGTWKNRTRFENIVVTAVLVSLNKAT